MTGCQGAHPSHAALVWRSSDRQARATPRGYHYFGGLFILPPRSVRCPCVAVHWRVADIDAASSLGTRSCLLPPAAEPGHLKLHTASGRRCHFISRRGFLLSLCDRREPIVECGVDRSAWVRPLGSSCERFHWRVHATALENGHGKRGQVSHSNMKPQRPWSGHAARERRCPGR